MSAKHGRTDGTCAHFVPAETCPDCKRPFEPEGNAVSDRAAFGTLVEALPKLRQRGLATTNGAYILYEEELAILIALAKSQESDLQALREREITDEMVEAAIAASADIPFASVQAAMRAALEAALGTELCEECSIFAGRPVPHSEEAIPEARDGA